jgi:hydrogenase nickel incorporation protein HypA/HybF
MQRAPVSIYDLCCPDCIVPAQVIITGPEIEVESLEVAA